MLTNERQDGVGGRDCVTRDEGTYPGLPFIGLDQARLSLALMRHASHWPCSGLPLIGPAQAGLTLAL